MALSMDDLNESVEQISYICPGYDHKEIKKDLLLTQNIEVTVNRLLDKSNTGRDAEYQNIQSSDDEELPVIFKQKYQQKSFTNFQSNYSNMNGCQSKMSQSPRSSPITIESDNDQGNEYTSKTLGRLDHCMSDSSDEDLDTYMPSLKERILGINSQQKLQAESSHLQKCSDMTVSTASKIMDQDEPTPYRTLETKSTGNQNSQQDSESGHEGKSKKKRSKEEIAESKRKAEMKRMERQKLREEKEAAKESEKRKKEQIRNAERERKKQLGGTKDCLQFVKMNVDTRIVNCGGLGVALLKASEALGVCCNTQEQPIPFSITWSREVTSLDVQGENHVLTNKSEQMEEDVLLLVPVADFVMFVENYKQGQYGSTDNGQTLTSYVHMVQQHMPGHTLALVVMGMEKFFREQKTQLQRKHRAAVLSNGGVQTQTVSGPSRLDVEEAITDNQLQTDVMVYLIESPEDVAEFVRTFTKAVAEKPAKKDRLQTVFHDDGIAAVKVDKNGHGLLKVWKQQLLQFKNISPDIADAIVLAYPSPLLLLEAYKKCDSEKEQQKLLENIMVRRGAGVLETARRVGKEMSRRIYTFMMSSDPNEIIK